MASALNTRQRLTQDARKHGISATLNFDHLGYRNARGVDTIHTAGREHVINLNVCVGGHVPKF
jgi:hypothetical protein